MGGLPTSAEDVIFHVPEFRVTAQTLGIWEISEMPTHFADISGLPVVKMEFFEDVNMLCTDFAQSIYIVTSDMQM
jgi:hypothetical protein